MREFNVKSAPIPNIPMDQPIITTIRKLAVPPVQSRPIYNTQNLKILEFTEIAAFLWLIIAFLPHFLSEARENHIVYAKIWKVCKVTQLFFTVRESRNSTQEGEWSKIASFSLHFRSSGFRHQQYCLLTTGCGQIMEAPIN